MNFCWSVWLIPHNNIINFYSNLINHFSKQYDSPIFQPHVTLLGRVNKNPEKTFSFFDNMTENYGYSHLTPMKIVEAEQPWKSLVITLKMDESLKKLQNEVQNRFKELKKYIFNPHLSLAYGDIKIKKKDYNFISLDESICFSSVALVETSDDIDKWRVIKSFNLKNAER